MQAMFVPHLSTTQPSIFHSSSPKASLRHARKRAASLRQEQHYFSNAKPYQRSATTKTTERPRRSSSPLRTSSRRSDRQVYEMPLASTDVASITALAATARNLFRRAKISGPDFAAVAAVVRSLHTVIKHLRAEAEDPDSLLNSTQQQSSVYARQLTPIVEDTDFTLKQLDTILEKYGSYPSDYNNSNDDGESVRRDRASSTGKIEDRERDMLQLIRTKLANQKTHIDIFLDTVQLHNPSNRPADLQLTDDKQQNSIKDKVDIVAQRLFQRRAKARALGDAGDESEEEMWQQFWTELVKEGFSSDVLRKHKEVLRAYIRELEENGSVDDNPPSVRGLLDHANSGAAYAPHQYLPYPDTPAPAYGSRQQYGCSPLPPPVAIPSSYQSRGDNTSPKELLSPAMENEKFAPGVKLARRRPDQSPVEDARSMGRYIPTSMPVQLSYEHQSSDSTSDTDSSEQLALISTRDLMDSDSRDADRLASRVGALNLSPALLPAPGYGVSPRASPNGRYLPPTATQQGATNQPPELNLSSSPGAQALGTSPRYLPPLSTYSGSPSSTLMTPPPPYSTTTGGATAHITVPSSVPEKFPSFPPRPSRLAPDSKGADIPLEAKWTRIKRSLVSPEVLSRAGMRYEARPDFVAVLGELTREQIAHLARKSVEVRTGRARGYSDTNRPREKPYYPDEKRGAGRKSSRHEDTTDDEASLTSSEVLWDESDSSDSDSDSQPSSRTRERAGSATDKYIPRDVRRQRRHRRDSATVIQEEPEDADDDRRGKSRTYPIIVPPMNDKGSPSATVLPKPILKNRNENHVRFDEDGPREMSSGELEREKERRRRRRDREADESRRRRDRSDRDRERGDRDREREREQRDRSDRHREREHHSSSHRHRGDREDAKERRRTKKSVWGETLGAVGIGGAAVSLLSVLTEAAAGF